jgi:hypothetical protein
MYVSDVRMFQMFHGLLSTPRCSSPCALQGSALALLGELCGAQMTQQLRHQARKFHGIDRWKGGAH